MASQAFDLDEEASPDAIEIYDHRLRKKLNGTIPGSRDLQDFGTALCTGHFAP